MNVYLRLLVKPHKKEKLLVSNNVLKLASKLLKVRVASESEQTASLQTLPHSLTRSRSAHVPGAELAQQGFGAHDEPAAVQHHARRRALGLLVDSVGVFRLQTETVEDEEHVMRTNQPTRRPPTGAFPVELAAALLLLAACTPPTPAIRTHYYPLIDTPHPILSHTESTPFSLIFPSLEPPSQHFSVSSPLWPHTKNSNHNRRDSYFTPPGGLEVSV